MAQYFTLSDYSMSLPIILLTLFALDILLIDLWIPIDRKWFNALTAFVGVLVSASEVSWSERSSAGRVFFGNFCLWPLAVLWPNGKRKSCRNPEAPRPRDGGTGSCQSDRCDRSADYGDRPVFQNRCRSVSSVGAGRIRRRSDQHDGIYVSRGESSSVGHAAADSDLGTCAFTSGLRSAPCICLDCNHDRREPGGSDTE